jgi:hypothetical protein
VRSRPLRLVFASLALALVAFPLALRKPGPPLTLKADEPAYYLMALSIARDFDLRCDTRDLERLFEEFPYGRTDNLIVGTDDGWRTIHFAKPYAYSFFAAPFAAVAGAQGMVAFNWLLLLGMIWLGARYLGRSNPGPVALLFASGFFLLSAGVAYTFWLHPEIFMMAAVTVSLYFGLTEHEGERPERWWRRPLACPALRLALSGAALTVASYHKPVYAALALPVLYRLARGARWRHLAVWLGSSALAGLLLVAGALAWTGKPSAYFGQDRAGFSVDPPGVWHRLPEPAPAGGGTPAEPPGANSWGWIFRAPESGPARLVEDFGYFLCGRHTGLFPYHPFTLLALLLFLLGGRRSGERWALLAALALVMLFFLLQIPFNWHGGGGFIGNRYYVAVVPGFLFLVNRIAPLALLPLGFAAGGLLIGPLFFSPLGVSVYYPTLQAHVRNRPFDHLPFEHSLAHKIPGYRGQVVRDLWFFGRRDVFFPQRDELLVSAGPPVEIWLESERPLANAVFELRSPRPGQRISISVAGERRTVELAADEEPERPHRIEVDLPHATLKRDEDGTPVWLYRIVVRARRGAQLAGGMEDDAEFQVGARLSYYGSREEVAADLYHAEWGPIELPAEVIAGGRLTLPVTIRNASKAPWPASAGGRVQLSYHWLAPDGSVELWEGERTRLPADLAPGEQAALPMQIAVPNVSGSYDLVLEPVREGIAWFHERGQGNTLRRHVIVLPAVDLSEVTQPAGSPAHPG